MLGEELGQRRLARLQRLTRFRHLAGQEPGGVAPRRLLLVHLLGDGFLGQRVGGPGCELGVAAPEGDLHQPRVADRLDLETFEERLGEQRGLARDGLELRIVLEVQQPDHAVREAVALQEPVIGLQLGLGRFPAVVPDALVELQDARLLAIDAEHGGRGVHRPRGHAPHEGGEHRAHEHEGHRPPVPHDHPPVVPEVRFLLRAVLRLQPQRGDQRREVTSVRQRARECIAHMPFATPRAPLKKSRNP